MATKTSTAVKTVYRDGKKYAVKTVSVTRPDGSTTTETFVEENEMEKDLAEEEFESFKRRLEARSGEGNERNDGAREDDIEPTNEETKPDSDGQFTKYQRECLESHNIYRAKHGVQPLTLDKKLCELAQAWSDHLLDNDKFQHRPDCKFGENIYSSWSSASKIKIKGKDAVDSWYKEVEKYNYDTETGNAGTGHFTQLVWSGSAKLGVGVASKHGKVIVVANYDPPGNFRGKFSKNVFKPKI